MGKVVYLRKTHNKCNISYGLCELDERAVYDVYVWLAYDGEPPQDFTLEPYHRCLVCLSLDEPVRRAFFKLALQLVQLYEGVSKSVEK